MDARDDYGMLLTLLRSALWDKEADDLSPLPLDAERWRRIYTLAREQTVTGLVYDALRRLPDALLPPQPLLLRWVAEADVLERRNRRMNGVLADLCGRFARHGLQAVVLKGQSVASLYDAPLLRECGDIDLYFDGTDRQERAVIVMEEEGIRPQRMPDGSVEYEWKGVVVEHHPRLLDVQNPFCQRYLDGLTARMGFEETALAADPQIRITVPSPTLLVLMLNVHIMKHALGWGIGLRQLCDMARACHTLHGRIDADELREACRQTGIARWTRLLHSVLTEHLGLDPGRLPYSTEPLPCDGLLDIVWRGGNFGQYAGGRRTESAWRRKLHTAKAFCRQGGFSLRYMPQEAFWHFVSLAKGQFNG